MNAEELDREWSAWLEERKRPAPHDPEFTRRVMAAVRSEAHAKAGNPSAEPAGNPSVNPSGNPTGKPGGSIAWQRARPAWPEWIRGLLSPRPALAFASLALASVLAIRYLPSALRTDAESVRIKGESFRIGYLLKRGERILPARSGEAYLPGDRLQALYSADRAGYIRFFSVDASGRIECLSCTGNGSLSPAGQEKTFPFALELDADPADEALVGVWTPAPSDPQGVESWLRGAWERSGRKLPDLQRDLSAGAPSGSRLSFFLLRKKTGV